jgi:homogentisate phytyltransferase / homogentisate geranylgeranyltransferase
MIKSLQTLWQFSRPHTIIGSVVSVTTLWLLAMKSTTVSCFPSLYENAYSILISTLIVAICCNIFIVGLNQITDVALDKINKPKLPLANGSLTMQNGKRIILTCLGICLVLSFLTSNILGWLIVIICLIGAAYSLPPLHLKQHHLPAAIAITVVRGVLVNLGMYLHFKSSLKPRLIKGINIEQDFSWQDYSLELIILTIFVIAFSIAIAWFKDLPDTLGDAQFKIKTLALVYSPKAAFYGGLMLVGLAYLFAMVSFHLNENALLFYCHFIAFIMFVINAVKADLTKPKSVTRFYMVFWVFFFAEYLFFAFWALT